MVKESIQPLTLAIVCEMMMRNKWNFYFILFYNVRFPFKSLMELFNLKYPTYEIIFIK